MQTHRNKIYCLTGEIVSHQSLAADQYILRIQAPELAQNALAGQFVHLQCNPNLPMRRPFSIMLVDPLQGWIDILYKIAGSGTRLLSQCQHGDSLNLLGPIGRPFDVSNCERALMLGGGVGIPPLILLAQQYMAQQSPVKPLVLLGSEIPFPFSYQPSQMLLPDLPSAVIASMPLLDDWGIPNRLCSSQDYPGCFKGFVTDLAKIWLQALSPEQRTKVEIFACGPQAMLKSVANLAKSFGLTAQLCVEEYMACGVGGCAGCALPIKTEHGTAMRRACVDGPVFTASELAW